MSAYRKREGDLLKMVGELGRGAQFLPDQVPQLQVDLRERNGVAEAVLHSEGIFRGVICASSVPELLRTLADAYEVGLEERNKSKAKGG